MIQSIFKKKAKKTEKVRDSGVVILLEQNCYFFLLYIHVVFTQVLVGFRYGREDLDVLGLNFRRDLVDVSVWLIILYIYLIVL